MKACIIPASRKPSSRYGDISLSRCIISCISFILYGRPAPARQCALSSAKIITFAEMSRACECHRLPQPRRLRPRAEEGKVLSPAGHYRVRLAGEKRHPAAAGDRRRPGGLGGGGEDGGRENRSEIISMSIIWIYTITFNNQSPEIMFICRFIPKNQ